MKKHIFLNLVANLLGTYDVDWDVDYRDDGYTDITGRAPLEDSLFYGDLLVTELQDNMLEVDATNIGKASSI